MRYAKGTIDVNPTRDVPLLQQVLHCGFVTGTQLFRFMYRANCEQSQRAFSNRVRRLRDHGLIAIKSVTTVSRGPVYVLTDAGASVLMDVGELYAGRSGVEMSKESVIHWLDINELWLSLIDSGLLAHWTPASEICSQNDLTRFRYAKDYDAVISVRLVGGEFRFGFEYERTIKACERYAEIGACIATDMHLDVVLYAASNYHAMCFLRDQLKAPGKTLCIGLMNELQRDLLNALVTLARSSQSPAPFHEYLAAQRVSTRSAPRGL